MKNSPSMLAGSAAGRFVTSFVCLMAVSPYVGCSDDEKDPISKDDAAAFADSDSGSRVDGGAGDASAPADASSPDASSTADAATSDAGDPPAMDAGTTMDASTDAASDDAAIDAAMDAGAADGAVDAGDAATDAAQDGATSDAGGDAGSGWPVPGCDQSYRFVARSGNGGRFSVPQGDRFEVFTFDAPWGDQEVQAIAFRPVVDNERVVKRMRLEFASDFQVLTHFAAGDEQPTVLPSNMGVAMPRGDDSVLLIMRYINETGGTRTDQSGIDVCIVRSQRRRPVEVTTTDQFVANPPVIRAGESNVEVTSVCNVDNVQPVYLMSANPYAHHYAVWAKFTVTKEDGTKIDMHHQAYDFDNRNVFYPLPNEVMVEKGDQVTTTCVFTNPSDEDLPVGGDGDISEGLCMNLAMYHPAPPAGVLRCIPEP